MLHCFLLNDVERRSKLLFLLKNILIPISLKSKKTGFAVVMLITAWDGLHVKYISLKW